MHIRKPGIFTVKRLKMDYPLYLMLALPVIMTVIFRYVPMFGVVIAFKDYLPAKGVLASPWVGLRNFRVVFNMPGFYNAVKNTLTISVWKIVLGIIVPVTFSLMLNEIKNGFIKRGVQTLVYLPHFISWVLLAGIFMKLLGGSGIVNQILQQFGRSPIIFLGDNRWFQPTIIATDIWKNFGFGTIVYLAAISGVNVELYEAAQIDGAGHIKQTWHITLPAITPTIVLLTALSLGSVLDAGFDQIFNLYNPVVYETGDIIDTLVYRIGFGSGQFGISTATGLFKSAVAMALIIASHRIAYRTTGYRVF